MARVFALDMRFPAHLTPRLLRFSRMSIFVVGPRRNIVTYQFAAMVLPSGSNSSYGAPKIYSQLLCR
jgi:hypothetical protein